MGAGKRANAFWMFPSWQLQNLGSICDKRILFYFRIKVATLQFDKSSTNRYSISLYMLFCCAFGDSSILFCSNSQVHIFYSNKHYYFANKYYNLAFLKFPKASKLCIAFLIIPLFPLRRICTFVLGRWGQGCALSSQDMALIIILLTTKGKHSFWHSI